MGKGELSVWLQRNVANEHLIRLYKFYRATVLKNRDRPSTETNGGMIVRGANHVVGILMSQWSHLGRVERRPQPLRRGRDYSCRLIKKTKGRPKRG